MTTEAIAASQVHLRAKVADPRTAAFAVAFGTIAGVGALDGGYYDESWLWIGLALAAVSGLRLALGDPCPERAALSSLGALTALALLMLASARWGIAGTEAAREAGRCAVYVAGLAALLVASRRATTRTVLAGVLCGGLFLGVVALFERLVSPRAPDPYQGTLLYGPVGYANALGVLVALSLVLAIGLFLETRGRSARLALAAGASVSAVALALTSSRGAWLAALIGLVTLATFRMRSRGRCAVALCALITLGASVALVTPSTSLGDRPAYWRVAAADAVEHPILGSGAGSFDDYWLAHRPIAAYVQDAHSLYLETVAELGIVGVALLGCALLVPLASALGTRRRPLVPVAAAAYVTFLAHAGLDWDWEMPATIFAGLACGAALLGEARRAEPARAGGDRGALGRRADPVTRGSAPAPSG